MQLLILAVLIGCFAFCPIYGQSTFATITGVVTDPTGAVVPNATIEITLVDRNQKFTAASNETGNYTFAIFPMAGTTWWPRRRVFRTSGWTTSP